MAGIDSRYWSNHFEQVFCKQITTFTDSIENRVLPAFEQIESEADAAIEKEWERLGDTWSEYSDMGDYAELAYEAGIEYYQSLEAVRQALINITATTLYHLFEQQVFYFHRKQLLYPEEEDTTQLINMKVFKERLFSSGISIETLSTWAKIEELKVVADVVKHAEGRSANKLRPLRPDLFNLHAIQKETFFNFGNSTHDVYLPLAGQDIYLSIDDLRAYSSALVSFWQEFANLILNRKRVRGGVDDTLKDQSPF